MIPGMKGKFGLGEQNEAGKRLTEFCHKYTLVIAKHPFPITQEMTLHMDITKWSKPKAEEGEAVYSQQKQDLKLTVAQIISFS